jgi:hypothetical protein
MENESKGLSRRQFTKEFKPAAIRRRQEQEQRGRQGAVFHRVQGSSLADPTGRRYGDQEQFLCLL